VELSALSVSPFWLSHVEVDAVQFSTKFRRWTSERSTIWYREYLRLFWIEDTQRRDPSLLAALLTFLLIFQQGRATSSAGIRGSH
jgi:hypothetical protein